MLAAVFTTYAQTQRPNVPVVEDVLKQAGISRATFYVHFVSLEDAVAIIGQDLVGEMLRDLHALFQRADDPLTRMVTGIQIFLTRAVTDPLWGDFVTRTNFISPDTPLVKAIALDLTEAKQQRLLDFTGIDAATSLFIGTMIEAIRHLVKTEHKTPAYIEEVTILILRGLRIKNKKATRLVRERASYIAGLAPDHLPWWRDPWRLE